MKLVAVSQMRQIESEANASGLSYAQMMENAGRGIAEHIQRHYRQIADKSILALVG